jgi:hypothetical protein
MRLRSPKLRPRATSGTTIAERDASWSTAAISSSSRAGGAQRRLRDVLQQHGLAGVEELDHERVGVVFERELGRDRVERRLLRRVLGVRAEPAQRPPLGVPDAAGLGEPGYDELRDLSSVAW